MFAMFGIWIVQWQTHHQSSLMITVVRTILTLYKTFIIHFDFISLANIPLKCLHWKMNSILAGVFSLVLFVSAPIAKLLFFNAPEHTIWSINNFLFRLNCYSSFPLRNRFSNRNEIQSHIKTIKQRKKYQNSF